MQEARSLHCNRVCLMDFPITRAALVFTLVDTRNASRGNFLTLATCSLGCRNHQAKKSEKGMREFIHGNILE